MNAEEKLSRATKSEGRVTPITAQGCDASWLQLAQDEQLAACEPRKCKIDCLLVFGRLEKLPRKLDAQAELDAAKCLVRSECRGGKP